MWDDLMSTITLVLISSLISIIIGVPLGILMSKSDTVEKIVKPLLDLMQTMPGFLYLIPAVAFFGIGMVRCIRFSYICITSNSENDKFRHTFNLKRISRDIRFIWINFLAKIVQT